MDVDPVPHQGVRHRDCELDRTRDTDPQHRLTMSCARPVSAIYSPAPVGRTDVPLWFSNPQDMQRRKNTSGAPSLPG